MKISADRLALTQELHALVIDYWHDVDTNWGANAPDYYTDDGVFVGPAASYEGKEKIRAFYQWRKDRGDRTVVHSVQNFQALPEGSDKATCHWFLFLYAADGKPVLPTNPPIQIAYMTDRLVKDPQKGWLVTYRRFEEWFAGGAPTTNPTLDDD
ncbi:nuclear transport factor 2 family protein [Microbaculum marinum]|uniref:Nuclear transport factor 2 family protein n=1 Tax=Microbaculum marinum TaxID=1764581 RepID=A0AAW9RH56_9HYPH